MGSGSKPKTDPNQAAINQLTLKRLQREEADLAQQKADRERLLASGRMGRASLLTSGYSGPAAGAAPSQSSAISRAEERGMIKEKARVKRESMTLGRRGKGGQQEVIPFSADQLAWLKKNTYQPETKPFRMGDV